MALIGYDVSYSITLSVKTFFSAIKIIYRNKLVIEKTHEDFPK